jgi:hypothetical protein
MKRDAEKGERGRSVVSLPNAVYQRARELSEEASQHGWAVLGIDRRDPPGLGAIIDEALNLLAERLKKTKARK